MRFYLDSNVFISVIRSEIGKGFELMHQRSEDFFASMKKGKHVLVLSSLFFDEAKRKTAYSKQEIIDFFQKKGIAVELVFAEKGDELEIKKLARFNIHYSDLAHLFLAFKSNCDAIVTWNLKDFEQASELIKIMAPEQLDQFRSS